MKNIYLYFYKDEILFYSTAKRAFEAAKANGESMHKSFTVFRRWLFQDKKYQFGNTTNEIKIRPLN